MNSFHFRRDNTERSREERYIRSPCNSLSVSRSRFNLFQSYPAFSLDTILRAGRTAPRFI